MKAMTEKYNNLNVQIDKIVSDANAELTIMNQKLNSMLCHKSDAFSTKIEQTCK